MVVTLPKLRRMMCTGTLILKANAQLFSMLMPKNMDAMNAHLEIGTFDLRRVYAPPASNWDGYELSVANTNCKNVMIRPRF